VLPAVQTAPLPVLGGLAQLGGVGVPLDVAADAQEVVVVLDRKALVAPLIKVPLAGRPVVGVVPLGVRQRQPLTKPRHGPVEGRTQDQVPVVGHREPIRLILLIGLVQTKTLGLLLTRWLCCV